MTRARRSAVSGEPRAARRRDRGERAIASRRARRASRLATRRTPRQTSKRGSTAGGEGVRADARRHVRRGASRGVAWSRAADASQRIDERRKSSQFWITRMMTVSDRETNIAKQTKQFATRRVMDDSSRSFLVRLGSLLSTFSTSFSTSCRLAPWPSPSHPRASRPRPRALQPARRPGFSAAPSVLGRRRELRACAPPRLARRRPIY